MCQNRTVPLDDVLAMTALEQAALIKRRELSSLELVRATLERIHAKNPDLHAFVSLSDQAEEEAKKKDQATASSSSLPTFHGVPIGIKDLNFVKGMRTRFGSRGFMAGFLPSPVDDKSARAAKRGGFVIVGKTATSEVGAMPVTEPDIHPPTRNPWHTGHSAGGSSGGAASAVAGGLLPIAHGSDGGGSVRIPSSFCSLFGIKPSRGRVANAFGLPDRSLLYTCGPLARSVSDAAALLDVMAGLVDGGAPHWAPPPLKLYRETTEQPLPRLRLRFTTRAAIGTVDPDVKDAVERAAGVFAELGHDVAEAEFAEGTLEEFLPIWQLLIAQVPLLRWKNTQPITRWLGDAGRVLDKHVVAARFDELRLRFLASFTGVDAWLSPTSPQTAPAIGAFKHADPRDAFTAAAPIGAFTVAFNVTGQPAASIPLGVDRNGLPIGLQIAGKPLADDTVLALARELERARPWQRLPSAMRH